jgi:beta-lactamase regulating signal transducer with metallopeptidase domain
VIALWMLYAGAVALLLCVAAWSAEHALRLQGRPGRWVWALALAASVVLPALSVFWPTEGEPAAAAAAFAGAETLTLSSLRTLLPSPRALDRAAGMLVTLWAGLSVVAGVLFALGAVQVARARRRWGRARVAGWDVRIAPAFGPAVVGVRRPEIVLPQWALALDEASLELVLGHEREHLEGRDTLLLSAAFLIAASAPWNPFLWLQLRRLRMAVELDCDARVLRGGADRRRYGALLLHVGERGPRMSIAAAALAEPTSFLERRLRMITESRRRGWMLRSAAALGAAGTMFVLACEVPQPTTVEPTPPSQAVEAFMNRLDGATAPVGQPAIFVDGVRLTGDARAQLAELKPAEVLRVEVIKGAMAQQLFPGDAEAAFGVIQVFTKKGRDGR